MVLRKFAYKEYPDSPRYWELVDFNLLQINLVVGKNSAGKSRTLNVIDGLSNLFLSPAIIFNNGYYYAAFQSEENKTYEFSLGINNAKIIFETLKIDGEPQIERIESNEGRMYNEEAKKFLSFELPENQLASTRRDKMQYPYLENIFKWATTLRHFHFNTPLGKSSIYLMNTIANSASNVKPLNIKETERVIETFVNSNAAFDMLFKKKVMDDFNKIGYNISDIIVDELPSLPIKTNIQVVPKGLLVKEKDREGFTDQHEMSMGMFRALSILIFFNSYELDQIDGCILIDDIGEGLDYEKSTNLINLLIEKSKNSKVQLIMSTNDKFVMNNTDLQYWQILKREGPRVKLFNSKNSEKHFEEFKYMGLNNFDFFRSDFFEKGLSID